MKRTSIFSVLVALIMVMTSCYRGPQPYGQQIYSQDGYTAFQNGQTVTIVRNDGISQVVSLMIWQQMLSNSYGSPTTNINNYYQQNTTSAQQQVEQTRQVPTQKSNGFGSYPIDDRPTEVVTQKSNGFGFNANDKRPPATNGVQTQKSNGFGSSSSTSVTTKPSSGFGNTTRSSNSISTKPSSGFGSSTKSSVTTKSSSGFGKKN